MGTQEAEEISLENIFAISKNMIQKYCEQNGIDDEKAIHPANWSDILDEINNALLPRGSRLLKMQGNLYNQYDLGKVVYLYERVYKKLCNIYIQEINQKDFLILSGIDKQSLYNWSNNINNTNININSDSDINNNSDDSINSDVLLSCKSFDFIEKINEDNEASLWGLMKGDKGNPNKWFGKMNRYHGWNGAGTTAEVSRKQSLTAAELPKLGANSESIRQIAQSEITEEIG